MPLSSEPRRSPPAKQIYKASIILRLALAVGLLSAVADRFGLWGPPGKPMVAWGTFTAFLTYTAQLNPWCPSRLIPSLGWTATVAETLLGIALLAGYKLRVTAAMAAALTAAFGFAMTLTLGIHEPLNYSVFSFAAGAYLLSCIPEEFRSGS
jgi:putative oxidoreductase